MDFIGMVMVMVMMMVMTMMLFGVVGVVVVEWWWSGDGSRYRTPFPCSFMYSDLTKKKS